MISDISVNSYNDFSVIGQEGTVLGWDKELKRYKQYPGKMKGASAIALASNNEVFICKGNTIHRFIPQKDDRFKGVWKKIPGCCKDIDTDGYGLVVVVGCDKFAHGFGIWVNLGGDYHKWKRILGEAMTVGVGSRGHIVVSNKENDIFWKDNKDAKWIKTPGKAIDVTVSVGGRIVVLGTDHHVYFSKTEGSRPQFEQNNGMGYRISAWSWRNPMVVGMDHMAWLAEKK